MEHVIRDQSYFSKIFSNIEKNKKKNQSISYIRSTSNDRQFLQSQNITISGFFHVCQKFIIAFINDQCFLCKNALNTENAIKAERNQSMGN